MRWSPKYVSPLVRIPIERMLLDRISSGYKLQAIVGAMCVSHAELVCEQLKALFPELAIDWVGTGTNGRPSDVNQKIIEQFCPRKETRADGRTVRKIRCLMFWCMWEWQVKASIPAMSVKSFI